MTDLFSMTRRDDHHTSEEAAASVVRPTLRKMVANYALRFGTGGFIDDDLKACWPDHPESSVRKRRTEMTQQNILLDSGRTRRNRNGREEKVWVHRDFVNNPPPILDRPKYISKDDQIVRLEAQVASLRARLTALGEVI